ncbi:NUDIX domain-containing protein [Fictibacillus iocasae]|uniref:NUDIX domain-containing protein n=1 Tax=Fictibacillus iocasae TaxID=2715437 RepID=A0ABW2NM35_9BACL
MTSIRTAYAMKADQERLRIFDSNRIPVGTASRSEVHEKGYYHEAFHCWFVSKEDNEHHIYLQLRSKEKKDHPGLFDITAAGHLTAEETVADGVREIKEELGVDVPFDNLQPLGMIPYHYSNGGFIDNELAHVFLYQHRFGFHDFQLQTEETEGIVKTLLHDFSDLWNGHTKSISLTGVRLLTDGSVVPLQLRADSSLFVPHEISYYRAVLAAIQEKLAT